MRGISIIGAVFALLILAIFGTAIVVLVGTDQDVRRRQIEKEQAFYEVQAGLEYAIREIDQGGYPVVTNKQLGSGSFTNTIDYSQHLVTSTGTFGDISKTHQITFNPMGGDCVNVDTIGYFEAPSYTIYIGAGVTKTCLSAISIDRFVFSWDPDAGQKVTRVLIDGAVVYSSATGTPSGGVIDIADYRISDGNYHDINQVRFTGSMQNTQLTMTVYFTDTSFKSALMGNLPGFGP